MAQLHVTVSAATHLYVSSHFIPHRDQMTQLGVCLSDMMRGLDWLGWWSRLHMAEQQAPLLLSSISFLLSLFPASQSLPYRCKSLESLLNKEITKM